MISGSCLLRYPYCVFSVIVVGLLVRCLGDPELFSKVERQGRQAMLSHQGQLSKTPNSAPRAVLSLVSRLGRLLRKN